MKNTIGKILLCFVIFASLVSAAYAQSGNDEFKCDAATKCPTIYCITTPCNQYSCVDGKCVFESGTNDSDGNKPPKFELTSEPTSLAVNQQGAWEAVVIDPEGRILKYMFAPEDGPVSEGSIGNLYGSSSGECTTYADYNAWKITCTHSFPEAGTYETNMILTDDAGQQAKWETNVKVQDSNGYSIELLSPNGGEVWQRDSTQYIKWASASAEPLPLDNAGAPAPRYASIKLFSWENPCKGEPCPAKPSALYTITEKTENNGLYKWSVGQLLEKIRIPEGKYGIVITDLQTGESDQSDEPFAIVESGSKIKVYTKSDLYDTMGQYFEAVFEAYGGLPPYKWKMTSGNLPPGLNLVEPAIECIKAPCPKTPQNTVWLVGTPKKEGKYEFELTASDSNGKEGKSKFTAVIDSGGSSLKYKVISPNGNEVWAKGSTQIIRWATSNSGPINSIKAGYGSSGNSGYVESVAAKTTNPSTTKPSQPEQAGTAPGQPPTTVTTVPPPDSDVRPRKGYVNIYIERYIECDEDGPCPLMGSVLYKIAETENDGSFEWEVGKVWPQDTLENAGKPVVSKESGTQKEETEEYWTEERMKNAKPVPTETVRSYAMKELPAGRYMIRVADAGTGEFDQSDDPFAIVDEYYPVTPVCDKIGTKQEGWYAKGKLVKYDQCSCYAVCREAGTEKEGYYSSCSNELIEYAKCSGSKEDPNQPVSSGERRTSDAVYTISESAAGYLPEEAIENVVRNAKITEINEVKTEDENGRTLYEVQGTSKEYFLWIFPYEVERTVKVDAATNEVVE